MKPNPAAIDTSRNKCTCCCCLLFTTHLRRSSFCRHSCCDVVSCFVCFKKVEDADRTARAFDILDDNNVEGTTTFTAVAAAFTTDDDNDDATIFFC